MGVKRAHDVEGGRIELYTPRRLKERSSNAPSGRRNLAIKVSETLLKL